MMLTHSEYSTRVRVLCNPIQISTVHWRLIQVPFRIQMFRVAHTIEESHQEVVADRCERVSVPDFKFCFTSIIEINKNKEFWSRSYSNEFEWISLGTSDHTYMSSLWCLNNLAPKLTIQRIWKLLPILKLKLKLFVHEWLLRLFESLGLILMSF